jgi:hypothetical protein
MIGKDKIYVYDAFTNLYKEDEFHLFPNELYLYCFLYRNRSHDYKVRMNVETVHQSMPVKFHPSKETKNRNEIKQNLLSLRNKRIISFHVDDKLFSIKSGNYASLEINFNRFTENKAGYTQVAYSDFDSAENINYFYITMAVGRYNNVKTYSGYGGRWISVNEFGKLLGVSGRTFKNYADDMISKGMLFKASGKTKENSNEQDKNTYKTVPYGFENKNATKVIQIESEQQKVDIIEKLISSSNLTQSEEEQTHNWYSTDKNIFPDVNDYVVYLETLDEKLKKHAKQRIDRFLNSDKLYAVQKCKENMAEAERVVHCKNKEKIANQKAQEINGYTFSPAILNNGDHIELSPNLIEGMELEYFFRNVDSISCVVTYDKKDMQGYSEGYFSHPSEIDIMDFMGDCNIATKEKVFMELKSLINKHGKLDYEYLIGLVKFRDNIVFENNKHLPYDVEHEGDEWIGYSSTEGENVSLKDRLNRHKRQRVQMEQTEIRKAEQEEKDNFIDSLFE